MYMYICIYVFGMCGFDLPARFRFRSVLITKTAVSVFFGSVFLMTNRFGFGRF